MKSHIKDTMYEIFPKERDDVDIISNTEIGNIKLFGIENKDRIKANPERNDTYLNIPAPGRSN